MRLTNDSEMDKMRQVGRGRHLTFIYSRVAMLRILNLQGPVFGMGLMNGTKPLVTSVGVATHRQKMHISMPHPRHLQRHLQIETTTQVCVANLLGPKPVNKNHNNNKTTQRKKICRV